MGKKDAKKKNDTEITIEHAGESVTLPEKDFNLAITPVGDLMREGAIKMIGGIKDCKMTEGGVEMKLVGFPLSGKEYEKVSRFLAEKESLTFLIIPQQADMFDK